MCTHYFPSTNIQIAGFKIQQKPTYILGYLEYANALVK